MGLSRFVGSDEEKWVSLSVVSDSRERRVKRDADNEAANRGRTMKTKMTRADLERFVLAEIAESLRCPAQLRISIQSRGEGHWAIVPLDQTHGPDPMCIRRIAAIAARFQIDFELVDEATT
jgi:hypothetical protein